MRSPATTYTGTTKNERWMAITPPQSDAVLLDGTSSNSSVNNDAVNDDVCNVTIDISKASVSKKEKTAAVAAPVTTVKSSEHLRQMLIQQDFAGTRTGSYRKGTTGRQDPTSSSIERSMSSLSSMSSMSTVGGGGNNSVDVLVNTIGGRYAPPSKSWPLSGTTKSKNNLLRYTNMDSKNSFGSISNNNRWRSSAAPSSSKVSSSLAAAVNLRYPIHKSSTNSNSSGSMTSLSSSTRNHHQRRRWLATAATERACGGDRPIGTVRRKSSSTYLVQLASA